MLLGVCLESYFPSADAMLPPTHSFIFSFVWIDVGPNNSLGDLLLFTSVIINGEIF